MALIYKIENLITNQIYVGKTTKSLDKRLSMHKAKHRKGKTYLYRSMRTYGFENFKISLLEECNDVIIDEREKYWIESLNSRAPENYNLTSGGEGGDTSFSPNYIEAIKNRDTTGSKNSMFGRKRSDTASYLAKGKEAMIKANRCPVMCEGVVYESVGAAQKAYPGISIRRRLNEDKYPEFYRLRELTRRK